MARLITEWAWLLPGLKPPQKMVLLCMARAAKDEDALFWESQQTICRRTGYDLKTVKAVIKHLCTTALIFDTGKRCGRTGSVIIYQIGGYSLAGLNDLQAQEKALTAERQGRVFERPLPEDLDTPASPKTDYLPGYASPKTGLLADEASPKTDYLPVDNFLEPAQKRTTSENSDEEASPKAVPLNGEASPEEGYLGRENGVKLARFSQEASPFFPPKLAQKRTTESLKESLRESSHTLLSGDAKNSQQLTLAKTKLGRRLNKRLALREKFQSVRAADAEAEED